ncbi:hypothetical protein [Persicobacter diffluens]|uniref:Uncharacterized protein n=1 Tax=Persicobacter diffluens TaxID=981 RepID=A0AAN4W5M9_9BACT|nr:hypothetical protein PEDI_52100 [Persicobacter diffluens]GJM65088.1 hypothetical protein PEDI_56400 [Persicobacter diffluens]
MDAFLCFLEKYKELTSIVLTIGVFILGYVLQRKARRIQSTMTWKEYRTPILEFANETIDVMSELEGLCEMNPEILGQVFYDKRNEVINKLSSLRDKGKLIIPNQTPNLYGNWKREAYKGIRHVSLDCLISTYYLAVALDFNRQRYNKQSFNLNRVSELDFTNKSITGKRHPNLIQGIKILKALNSLPEQISYDGFKNRGWSVKKGVVESKRQFTSIIQQMVNTRAWIDETKKYEPKSIMPEHNRVDGCEP